jgi:hypothetical protein
MGDKELVGKVLGKQVKGHSHRVFLCNLLHVSRNVPLQVIEEPKHNLEPQVLLIP